MKIKTLTTVIHDGEEFPAGALLDIEDSSANRLIRLKSAVLAILPEKMESEPEEEHPHSFGASISEHTDAPSSGEMERQMSIKDLCRIEGIDEIAASALYEAGYASVAEVSMADAGNLKGIKALRKKNIKQILKSAEELNQP